MAETIRGLRDLSDDELIQRHDAKAVNTHVGTNHYLSELARRDQARHDALSLKITQRMAQLTWAIFILTAVNVIVVVIALLQ